MSWECLDVKDTYRNKADRSNIDHGEYYKRSVCRINVVIFAHIAQQGYSPRCIVLSMLKAGSVWHDSVWSFCKRWDRQSLCKSCDFSCNVKVGPWTTDRFQGVTEGYMAREWNWPKPKYGSYNLVWLQESCSRYKQWLQIKRAYN
jgi:hypothetical protein